MGRISLEKAEKRNQILVRLTRFAHYAIGQLGGDVHMVKRQEITEYMVSKGIPRLWIDWCLSVALQQAHTEGRIEKAGASRGRGAGWKLNLNWWGA